MGEAGRPSENGIPTAAREVARVLSSGPPNYNWRFGEISSNLLLSYPGAERKSLDVRADRGLKWLLNLGYVTRGPEGGWRWNSPAWQNLAQMEETLWSIRSALGHIGELAHYRGRMDSTILQLRSYLEDLESSIPDAIGAVRAELVKRGNETAGLDLHRTHPDFRGKTGIIQKPLNPPPSHARCVTCNHLVSLHRRTSAKGNRWYCVLSRVQGPGRRTSCGCLDARKE
jgi:hypothetical protein